MKKVLILANHIDWIYSLRKELIERLTVDYKVIVCIPKCDNNFKLKYFKKKDVKFEFVNYESRGTNPFKDLALIINYYKLIKRIDPDIVLTYTIKPNIYGSYVSGKLDKPIIANMTGLGSAFNNKVLRHIVISLYKIAYKKVELVFFQNNHNYSLFTTNNIIDLKKSKLIPGSGVNIEKFRPMEKTKEDDVIRFLFIGRIMREKGIEEYLQVAENISKKYSRVEFQILGPFAEDEYRDSILNNKNDKIKYLGKSNDVRKEIREVDCVVNPSYHEGMSNVLLEGAAMGKPLIASNIPGCKEIVDDGNNGYLFEVKSVEDLEKKIIQFIGLDTTSKKIMGNNSRTKVENEFDRNIVIEEYIKAINNILKEGYKNESKSI